MLAAFTVFIWNFLPGREGRGWLRWLLRQLTWPRCPIRPAWSMQTFIRKYIELHNFGVRENKGCVPRAHSNGPNARTLITQDPYFMRNHLGTYECKLCLTLHNNEASYLAHTQVSKGKPKQTSFQILTLRLFRARSTRATWQGALLKRQQTRLSSRHPRNRSCENCQQFTKSDIFLFILRVWISRSL